MYQFWKIFTPETREKVADRFNNRGGSLEISGQGACPIGYAIMEEYGQSGYLMLNQEQALEILGPQAEFFDLDETDISIEIGYFMEQNDDGKIDNLRAAMGLEESLDSRLVVQEAEQIIHEHQLIPI
jgi:hypothetical protein